jgi:hypothetical protein
MSKIPLRLVPFVGDSDEDTSSTCVYLDPRIVTLERRYRSKKTTGSKSTVQTSVGTALGSMHQQKTMHPRPSIFPFAEVHKTNLEI